MCGRTVTLDAYGQKKHPDQVACSIPGPWDTSDSIARLKTPNALAYAIGGAGACFIGIMSACAVLLFRWPPKRRSCGALPGRAAQGAPAAARARACSRC